MVKNPRTPARAAGLLPLNLPEPAAVDTHADGTPASVLVRGTLRPVAAISDQWRIDDEWWRATISRRYFALQLEGGMRLTVFQDLVTGGWHRQQYTPPVRIQAV